MNNRNGTTENDRGNIVDEYTEKKTVKYYFVIMQILWSHISWRGCEKMKNRIFFFDFCKLCIRNDEK